MRRIKATNGAPEDFGLPAPDHKLGEAHPTISSDLLRPHRPRPGEGEAEHRAPRGRLGPLRRRLGRADRQDRLLHGLQDQLPVLRPRPARPVGGQPDRALPPRGAPRPCRALLHRADPAALRDHADRRAPVGVDRRRARGHVELPGRDTMVGEIEKDQSADRASATWPRSDTRSRSTGRTTCAGWRASASATASRERVGRRRARQAQREGGEEGRTSSARRERLRTHREESPRG